MADGFAQAPLDYRASVMSNIYESTPLEAIQQSRV